MLFFRSTEARHPRLDNFYNYFPESNLGHFLQPCFAIGTERAWKEASAKGTQITIRPAGHNPVARGAAP